ncbi:uncharacterized protein EI97DRAFT_294128 [Westerdykella ornata]|uniref:Uncharacterized protein n=1 Tax=Westerdykella ornata TaxID=318751 RepID=A0A6A6JMP2_WESOR|nr:uncharacterized protein EI97DRAFT_294128 [Westerdykella ornata]KAF2277495.1 hypothetical protein EI97DRAFT_294128 [Westerdykella ornata]
MAFPSFVFATSRDCAPTSSAGSPLLQLLTSAATLEPGRSSPHHGVHGHAHAARDTSTDKAKQRASRVPWSRLAAPGCWLDVADTLQPSNAGPNPTVLPCAVRTRQLHATTCMPVPSPVVVVQRQYYTEQYGAGRTLRYISPSQESWSIPGFPTRLHLRFAHSSAIMTSTRRASPACAACRLASSCEVTIPPYRRTSLAADGKMLTSIDRHKNP